MKALNILTILFFISISNTIFSQNVVCQKNAPAKKPATAVTKRKPLPKLSKKDSLLNEREFRIEEEEITRDLDLALAEMNYSPKVVVQKNNGALSFFYYKNINEKDIELIKQKLLTDFKGEALNVNPTSMNCKVGFKQEASEEDKQAFFREFGYEGIIYH